MAQEDQRQQVHQNPYPMNSNSYGLLCEIGSGLTSVVYKAECFPLNSTLVAIKSIDLSRPEIDLEKIRRETSFTSLSSHPNILSPHCSFPVDCHLWIVMPLMSAGSLHSIASSSFSTGLPEEFIAAVLKETLKALVSLHARGYLHRDIHAGNILVDWNGSVRLADFGDSVSASAPAPDSNGSVSGSPYWIAPEVKNGYGFKADIWAFGVTALELAHGRPPLPCLPLSKSLVKKIVIERFPLTGIGIIGGDKRNFSQAFVEMVKSCLDQDPAKRPSAEELLEYPFFKNSRSSGSYLVQNLLHGLPSVEERFEQSKLLPQLPEIVHEDGEGKRVRGWNFNEETYELDQVFPVTQRQPENDAGESNQNRSIQTESRIDVTNSDFREKMREVFTFLKKNMEAQRRTLNTVIGLVFPGEGLEIMETEEKLMGAVEEAKKLSAQLMYERWKRVRMEAEMTSLKYQLAGGSIGMANTNHDSGD